MIQALIGPILKKKLMSFMREESQIYPIFISLQMFQLKKENLGKFDAKSNKGTFLCYSLHKAYRV